MKNRISAFACLLFIFCLCSCKSDGPEATAEKFLNGFMHMDFESAKSVSTEQTKKILNMMEQLAPQMVPDSVKAERKKIKVKILQTDVNGNKAVVTYTTSESEARQKLQLIKQKDKWLVESSKLDQFNEAGMNPDQNIPSQADSSK